jgi:hypothetical protein
VSRSTEELERQLELARARALRAVEALRPEHRGGEIEELLAANRVQLEAERELSLARGQPTAITILWQDPWDTGATDPHVLSSGLKTLLLYRIKEPDPESDGSTARMVDAASDDEEPIAFARPFARHSTWLLTVCSTADIRGGRLADGRLMGQGRSLPRSRRNGDGRRDRGRGPR